MTDVDRPGTPRGRAWALTTLGAAVHVALARRWSVFRERRTPAGARTLLELAWPQHGVVPDGFDAAQSACWRRRAADMVERRTATLDLDEPLGVERTVSTGRYAVAAARALRRRCRRVELHHLPTGHVVAFEHTSAPLGAHLDRAEAAAVQAADTTDALEAGGDAHVLVPTRTSAGCACGDQLRACPEGRAVAGPPRRPWDGLPGEAA